MLAIAHRNASLGEAFHAVSPAAVTLRGDAISKSAIAESCYRSAEPGMAAEAAA
jgi:hypothetical protein